MNDNPHQHTTGLSLEGMSRKELEARLGLLFKEMQRIRGALEQKELAEGIKPTTPKDEVFKSLFPSLSNPKPPR